MGAKGRGFTARLELLTKLGGGGSRGRPVSVEPAWGKTLRRKRARRTFTYILCRNTGQYIESGGLAPQYIHDQKKAHSNL